MNCRNTLYLTAISAFLTFSPICGMEIIDLSKSTMDFNEPRPYVDKELIHNKGKLLKLINKLEKHHKQPKKIGIKEELAFNKQNKKIKNDINTTINGLIYIINTKDSNPDLAGSYHRIKFLEHIKQTDNENPKPLDADSINKLKNIYTVTHNNLIKIASGQPRASSGIDLENLATVNDFKNKYLTVKEKLNNKIKNKKNITLEDWSSYLSALTSYQEHIPAEQQLVRDKITKKIEQTNNTIKSKTEQLALKEQVKKQKERVIQSQSPQDLIKYEKLLNNYLSILPNEQMKSAPQKTLKDVQWQIKTIEEIEKSKQLRLEQEQAEKANITKQLQLISDKFETIRHHPTPKDLPTLSSLKIELQALSCHYELHNLEKMGRLTQCQNIINDINDASFNTTQEILKNIQQCSPIKLPRDVKSIKDLVTDKDYNDILYAMFGSKGVIHREGGIKSFSYLLSILANDTLMNWLDIDTSNMSPDEFIYRDALDLLISLSLNTVNEDNVRECFNNIKHIIRKLDTRTAIFQQLVEITTQLDKTEATLREKERLEKEQEEKEKLNIEHQLNKISTFIKQNRQDFNIILDFINNLKQYLPYEKSKLINTGTYQTILSNLSQLSKLLTTTPHDLAHNDLVTLSENLSAFSDMLEVKIIYYTDEFGFENTEFRYPINKNINPIYQIIENHLTTIQLITHACIKKIKEIQNGHSYDAIKSLNEWTKAFENSFPADNRILAPYRRQVMAAIEAKQEELQQQNSTLNQKNNIKDKTNSTTNILGKIEYKNERDINFNDTHSPNETMEDQKNIFNPLEQKTNNTTTTQPTSSNKAQTNNKQPEPNQWSFINIISWPFKAIGNIFSWLYSWLPSLR